MSQHLSLELALLETTATAQRSMLRARRPEDVVKALERAVQSLGGTLVPGHVGGDEVLQLDIGLGIRDALLPWAPPDEPARAKIQRVLPGLLEDARRLVNLLWTRDDLDDATLRDELTGGLHAIATARLVERSAADDTLVAFAVADTDAVEATHGRARGEVLLRQLAGFVRSELDVDERLGRLGGPAVVVLLRGDASTRTAELVARVTERWERQRALPVGLRTALTSRGEDPQASLAAVTAELELDVVSSW